MEVLLTIKQVIYLPAHSIGIAWETEPGYWSFASDDDMLQVDCIEQELSFLADALFIDTEGAITWLTRAPAMGGAL